MDHGAAVLDRPSALCTNWDYQATAIHARHYDVLEAQLKERGSEGWELVHITLPMPNEYLCVFKRPID